MSTTNMRQVSKKHHGGNQMSQSAQSQALREVEAYEGQASASAQAGLNLNIFGAISGVFGGRSKKVTGTAKDGSSHSVEDSEGIGHVNGAGAGNLKAVASGDAHSHEKYRKSVEGKQSQQQQKIDHLGLGQADAIEDAPRRKK